MSAKPKLTYFPFEGRAEVARLAYHIAGVEFEDVRVPFSEWPTLKGKQPWGSMPTLEVNGKVLAQSNSINRYVGRQTGLYPQDLWAAAKADEIMDAVEDVANKISATMSLPEAEKLVKRKEFSEGPLAFYLAGLERQLLANGGKFFAGTSLSVADLKVYGMMRWLSSGTLDGIDTKVISSYPNLAALNNSLDAHPKIADWHAKHPPAPKK